MNSHAGAPWAPPTLALLACLAAACADRADPPSTDPAPAPAAAGDAERSGEAAAPVEPQATAQVEASPSDPACVYADGADPQPGCPHGDPNAGGTVAAAAGHFGAPFSAADPAPLGSTLAGVSDAPVQVLVEGTIDRVCQKRGCWMVLREGEHVARVLMKDHAFVVPMDSKGKPAVVEGTLKARTFSEAQAKHLAADGGQDPSKVQGERREYVLTASGVEIRS